MSHDPALLYLSGSGASVCFGLQIDRSIFAATIDLDIEIETIALIEVGHACALDSADMNKRIRLAVIALDKAEAFHRIEELHRAAGVLTGQLALRPTAVASAKAASARFARTIDDREGLALDLEVGSRNLSATINQCEAERLSFGKPGQASLLDGADMNEHVFGAIVANDETETLLPVEEFYDAGAFADNLSRHASTAAAAATTKSAAAAAEAATITETATVSTKASAIIESTKPTGTLIGETTKIVAANIVALVSAASAATSIKTHARIVTFARPKQLRIDMSDEEHAESAA